MTAWEIIGILLITSPHEISVPFMPSQALDGLKRAAVTLDLVDDGNLQNTQWTTNYVTELRWLRKALVVSYGSPTLDDLNRFPDHVTCQEYVDFHDAWRVHLNMWAALRTMNQDWADVIIEDGRLCREAWSDLKTAHISSLWKWERRVALGRLRDLIGPDAYYASMMPPPVPIWRFHYLQ